MKRLFEGKVWVHDGQVYFLAGPQRLPEMAPCFRGQQNGICGAATPGVLFLMTGLHTGSVHLVVELCERPPALEEVWEDIVEASFEVPPQTQTGILEWGASAWHPAPLEPGLHRVRYCARNMQAGREVDTVQDHEDPVDFYRLVFWRASGNVPDCVLRQASERAAYCHAWARSFDSSASQRLEMLKTSGQPSGEILNAAARPPAKAPV